MDVKFGLYRLKRQERRVEGPDGPVELSARAFDLLCVLLDHAGDVVSKDTIFAAVWPGVVVEENTLQVHVSALRKALDPSFIATVHGRGYKYAGPVVEAIKGDAPIASTTPEAKPVIAVLPFDNLSGDPEQQYFSDGITQDIIDRLVRFRVLSVIGIDSNSMSQNAPPDIDAIQAAQGADFVVTGNIRRSESRIRISARLADTKTRKAIWAEHYDRPIAGLFEVQDEVAEMVAATVTRQLEIEIASRSMRRHPADLKSYELTLLGVWHYFKQTREGTDQAIECFERALAGDPGNVEALGWLGVTKCMRYETDFNYGELLKGLALICQGIALDPGNSKFFVGYSLYIALVEGIDSSRAAIDHALSLNPGDIYANVQRALVSIYDGQITEATDWLSRGHKLSPNPLPWVGRIRRADRLSRDALSRCHQRSCNQSRLRLANDVPHRLPWSSWRAGQGPGDHRALGKRRPELRLPRRRRPRALSQSRTAPTLDRRAEVGAPTSQDRSSGRLTARCAVHRLLCQPCGGL